MHCNDTPISVKKAIIHCSESSSTLFSGLLYQNFTSEVPFVDTHAITTDDGSARLHQESKHLHTVDSEKSDDHYVKDIQPTLAAGSGGDDTSEYSIYGNHEEALDEEFSIKDKINPGYTSKFPDCAPNITNTASFKEMRDDQYVFYNRDQGDSEMIALSSELSFIQVDDGDPSERNMQVFLSGYIEN